MFRRTKILYTIGILFIVFKGSTQPLSLQIVTSDTVLKTYLTPLIFLHEADLKKRLQEELLFWQKQDFLEANFDEIIHDSLAYTGVLHLGKPYLMEGQMTTGKKTAGNHLTHYSDWIKAIENKIKYLEQNGYPFAQVTVKKESLSGLNLRIELTTDSGVYITYDSLLIAGNSIQNKLFLMQYLNIKPNAAYNEEQIKQIDKRLQQLPFIRLAKASSVYFYKNKAQVIICIDDKPSNNFEGVLGIQNDEVNATKYKVNGDVNLQLNNVLGNAAALKLQWRRFGPQNADLTAMAYYPYILGAPIALSNEFSLFRQDSNFQRLKNNTSFGYLFSGLNALQFYYSFEKSNVTLTEQQVDEALTYNTLPSVNDYVNRNYGIKFNYTNLDNRVNPGRGINLLSDISAGTHQLLQSILLKDAHTSSGENYMGYSRLPKQETTFQLFHLNDVYFPLSKRNIINIFMQGASMYHPRIFYNEQYQLGGLRTFRGVNELAIKATSYALLRTEYRYILPQTGYFNLFCNAIWHESNLVNSYHKGTLWGFGAGIGLQTKGGILTLVYALANENGFVFKLGKIHLGFIALF